LRRALKRRTSGLWGGFWAGVLARLGVGSPLPLQEEIVILEESYEHTVAQYWYEALGLAVSEVALEIVTEGEWLALVPAFLHREKIDALVQFHLQLVQDSLGSPLGRKLAETDIREQRVFLNELAELLRPWWQHLVQPTMNSFQPELEERRRAAILRNRRRWMMCYGKRYSCDVLIAPSDMEVPHIPSTHIAFLSAYYHRV
jgi:hypothetical protein